MRAYTVVFALMMTVCFAVGTAHQAQCGGNQDLNEVQQPIFNTKPEASLAASPSFFGGFDFNGGDCEGWTAYGPLDEDGDGPFDSNFCFGWADFCNYPTVGLTDPMGDNQGSLKICCAGGHGITNPNADDYWVMYYVSPDLSTSGLWQNTDGYTVKIYNCMELIGAVPGDHLTLYVNLHVTIYDEDELRDRYFYCYSSAEPIDNCFVSSEWISMEYDWSSIIAAVPNYTVKEISVSIWGSMDDYFEGGIYLDEVNVTKPYAVPVLDLSIILDHLNDDLKRGTSTSKTLSIKNIGTGDLSFKLFAVQQDDGGSQKPGQCKWISFNPANGIVKADSQANVAVNLNAAFLLPGIHRATIRLATNDPQNKVIIIPVALRVKPNIDGANSDGIKTAMTIPLAGEAGLMRNYPNPFNPSTTITFNLSESNFVTMDVFNIIGQKVATLVNGNYTEGEYHVNWIATDVPSGVYFCVMRAGNTVQTRRLILEK
ncbi:T9SS type A sorting domain-containing protein [candidate division KSB1 bacterium]|nr:T9SS type A sorting domain-containing protein [candidate division KSB1 bacterium]